MEELELPRRARQSFLKTLNCVAGFAELHLG